MSKNMQSTGFRAINVDAYSEDAYVEEEEAETPGLGPDEAGVRSALSAGRLSEALSLAIANAPLKTKNQAVKDKATALVVSVLTQFKAADMEAAVAKLDGPQLDLLLKYIYKGFERPTDGSCGSLLLWHEKVLAKAGLGSIIRNFTDRRTL